MDDACNIMMNVDKNFVKKIHNELPPFKFIDYPSDGTKRVFRKKEMLHNGIEYEGEWNDKGEKDGRGIQVWPDGSIYEGHWKKGKANG